MYLSKRDNGVWYVWHYDEHGRKHKRSTGCKRRSDALRFLTGYKEELEKKKHPAPKVINFRNFVVEFMEFSKSVHTEATVKHFATAAREFEKCLGNPKLREIGARDIEKFLAVKSEQASRWTARKYYIALSSLFEKAREWGYVEQNVFRAVKRPTPPERRPLYFSKAELKALLASLEAPDLKILTEVAIYTGCRLGELLSLTWDDVDFEQMEVHVRNKAGFTTKTKRERTLPMHPSLKKLLVGWKKKSKSQLVFAREETLKWGVSQMSIRFKSALKKAPLEEKRKKELHFHSLRHTHATLLLQANVPIYSVSRLLGHSSVRTTEIYSHACPNDYRSQVERLTL